MSIRQFRPKINSRRGVGGFSKIWLTFLLALLIALEIAYPLVHNKTLLLVTLSTVLVGAIYGAIATLALAYSLFAFGVHRIGPANAVTVGLMEPITAAALGVTVLNEKITSLGFLGIALVLFGLFIVGRPVKTG